MAPLRSEVVRCKGNSASCMGDEEGVLTDVTRVEGGKGRICRLFRFYVTFRAKLSPFCLNLSLFTWQTVTFHAANCHLLPGRNANADKFRFCLKDVTLSHIFHVMLQRAINPIRRQLDQFGIGLSALCAVHCLLSIVLVSALGIGGEHFFSPDLHRYGLVIATLVAAVAIGWGALRHRMAAPFVIAMTGLTFMGGALAVPHGAKEAVLTIIGVALVSLGHVLNMRHSHSADCKHRCGGDQNPPA